MNLKTIVETLKAEVLFGTDDWENSPIDTVFASDLMSDVLMSDRDNMLIVTSLCTEQSVRSAGIVGSEALIIANNKVVSEGMIELAEELEVTLMCTKLPKYESCVRLGRIMEA